MSEAQLSHQLLSAFEQEAPFDLFQSTIGNEDHLDLFAEDLGEINELDFSDPEA